MKAIRFLLSIVLILSVYEVRQASSSEAAAQLTLETLKKLACDDLKLRLACLKRPYRTFDGTCNNLCNISNGAANEPFLRFPNLTTATFFEGDNFGPRTLSQLINPGTNERELLANPRAITIEIFTNDPGSTPSPTLTHLTMTYGQFLDHDLTLTESTGAACGTNGAPCVEQPDCIGIPLTSALALGGSPNAVCIPLARSFQNMYGEQINLITHYIDGSQIYGSDIELATALRDPVANLGFLLVRPYPPNSNTGPILPEAEENAFCRSTVEDEPCFIAGDERVNENQALMAMHTIWVREHNRVALYLHYLNPSWCDERLFQEARKIVIAEFQHITYNEWLAALFSEQVRAANGVLLLESGFFTEYDPHIKVGVFNSLATAALRMGHTLIANAFDLTIKNVPLAQSPTDFFEPSPLYMDVNGSSPYGAIMNGLAGQESENVDGTFTDIVREELIIEGPTIDGITIDLTAVNIQRGRDHGLPPYIWFREACGLSTPNTFAGLSGIFTSAVIDKLKQVYTNVFDIDLFAAIHEIPDPGNQLGPTFTCIFMQQFFELRHGDRFWYERDDECTSFTYDQLQQIRKSTIARILCDNALDVKEIQPKAFLQPDDGSNSQVHCRTLPFVDLNLWKDEAEVPAGEVGAGGGAESNAAVGA